MEAPYSPREEFLNTLTHAIGSALSLLGMLLLLVYAAPQDDNWRTVSFTIYGLCLFALYFASTLYHGTQEPRRKALFKTLDHCAIYLIIAGSYTPFLLITMREGAGWPLFIVIWAIAVMGIVLKLIFKQRFRKVRVATYVIMGWLIAFASEDLTNALPESGLYLLIASGLIYTIGVVFYLGHRIPFNHAIWHIFVLAGSALHYGSVFYYVLPKSV